jgi:hypothetical protein
MPPLVQPSPHQGFVSPPHFPLASLPSFEPLVSTRPHSTFEPSVPTRPHSTLLGFVGAKDDTLHGVLHEFAKEEKGKEPRSWRFQISSSYRHIKCEGESFACDF